MTEKERMLAGKLYVAKDEELAKDFMRSRKLVRKINETTEEQGAERIELFRTLFRKTVLYWEIAGAFLLKKRLVV